MNEFQAFLHNDIVVVGALAWLTAQVLKTITNAYLNRSLDLSRLLGDGGMPSAHSATVTSVALAAGMSSGFASPLFGVAFFFAIIVMHDAMGVRKETEKHAKVLNEIMGLYSRDGKPLSMEERFKEFVGHTPLQVFFGACLGVLVTFLYYHVI